MRWVPHNNDLNWWILLFDVSLACYRKVSSLSHIRSRSNQLTLTKKKAMGLNVLCSLFSGPINWQKATWKRQDVAIKHLSFISFPKQTATKCPGHDSWRHASICTPCPHQTPSPPHIVITYTNITYIEPNHLEIVT